MGNITKIFVGGSVMSGKNILWRLLDGHSTILSNCMHWNIGFFVLSDECKKFFLHNRPGYIKRTHAFVPMCNIVYGTGESVSVEIGDFFYALYSFSNYKKLYSWAKGKSTFLAGKEGEFQRLPFAFDVHGFEQNLEKELFGSGKRFTEEEILDVIYSSFTCNLGNTAYSEILADHDLFFVDTLPNGFDPAVLVVDKSPGAKVLLMTRDLKQLMFANAARVQSYGGDFQVDTSFRSILFNQPGFENKMNRYHENAIELQASNENVMLVDFDSLILNTKSTMRTVADFIGVEYEDILALPSIDGVIISDAKYPPIGVINDDPHKWLNRRDIDLLTYLTCGFGRQNTLFINMAILLDLFKWRHFTRIKFRIATLLKLFFPARIYSWIKEIYSKI